jgi:hypothetical protein
MRKIAALLALVMLVGCSESPAGNENPENTEAPTETTAEITEITTIITEPVSTSAVTESTTESITRLDEPNIDNDKFFVESITWIVEPTLAYDNIFYCSCGTFVAINDNHWQDIDTRTGRLTEDSHGHGGMIFIWVYDPQRDLFGNKYAVIAMSEINLHPKIEFAERFPEAVNQIMIVHEVDSSKRVPHFQQGEEFAEEAFSGRIAIAYNGKFVTDFDFVGHNRGAGKTLVTIVKDGKHGVIDKNGNVVIDFILDEIIIIDDKTAFAMYNGKYGIISIRGVL